MVTVELRTFSDGGTESVEGIFFGILFPLIYRHTEATTHKYISHYIRPSYQKHGFLNFCLRKTNYIYRTIIEIVLFSIWDMA